MSLTLWRVVKSRYRDEALSGEGARLYGGRWSSPGYPVIYCSQHLSLAILEILVHTQRTNMLSGYDQINLGIDPQYIKSVNPESLPENWNDPFPSQDLRNIGDSWFDIGESLALEVPSVILPQERNYLINPTHGQFKSLILGDPETITLDPRLFSN